MLQGSEERVRETTKGTICPHQRLLRWAESEPRVPLSARRTGSDRIMDGLLDSRATNRHDLDPQELSATATSREKSSICFVY